MTSRSIAPVATMLATALLLSACAGRPADRPDENIVSRQLAKSTRSWDGQTLPSYPQGQPEVTILRISIPPGAKLVTHKHSVINAGVLLSGELTVRTAEGKTLNLKAGDPIIEVVNTPHQGFNPGDSPAEIIVFYAGAEGAPITIVDN